jgi:hypothetical protein
MTTEENTGRSIKEERAESVKKAFESPEQGTPQAPGPSAPTRGSEGVGDSITRRAEDVAKTESEPGRYSTGTDDSPAERPTGESTQRDVSGLNPDEK